MSRWFTSGDFLENHGVMGEITGHCPYIWGYPPRFLEPPSSFLRNTCGETSFNMNLMDMCNGFKYIYIIIYI